MARSSAQVEVSRPRVARDLSEVPTTRMIRPKISRDEAYGAKGQARRPRALSLWSSAWKKPARDGHANAQSQQGSLQEPRHGQPGEAFVPPPWRFADWSFAVLAGIGGVLTTLAVFVLMSTKQLGPDLAPARGVPAHAVKQAPPPPAAEPPERMIVSGTALMSPAPDEVAAPDDAEEPRARIRSEDERTPRSRAAVTPSKEKRRERRARRP